jgi:hypothetical protein
VWIAAFAKGLDLAVELVETLKRGRPVPLQPSRRPRGKHYDRKGLSHYIAFARRRRQASREAMAAAS